VRTLSLGFLIAALTVACEHTGDVLYYGAGDVPRKSPDPRDLIAPNSDSTPPDMAGSRRITEVDCSKPVDPTLGNIRCK